MAGIPSADHWSRGVSGSVEVGAAIELRASLFVLPPDGLAVVAEKPLHARSQTLRLLLRRTGSDVLRGTAEVDGAGEQRLALRRVAPAEVEGDDTPPGRSPRGGREVGARRGRARAHPFEQLIDRAERFASPVRASSRWPSSRSFSSRRPALGRGEGPHGRRSRLRHGSTGSARVRPVSSEAPSSVPPPCRGGFDRPRTPTRWDSARTATSSTAGSSQPTVRQAIGLLRIPDIGRPEELRLAR